MLYANVHGSELYGCNTNNSDKDVCGVCLPPKNYLFPHLEGWINGFGTPPTFEQYQQHHIKFKEANYDFKIVNITKFLSLALSGNPDIIECLFAPQDCILHKTKSFQLIVDNKQEFLTKKTIPRFRGYLCSQIQKIKSKVAVGKRTELIEKFGYDVKFAYHAVRLGLYCEQILDNRWLALRRDNELFKSIRRGDFTLMQVEEMVQSILARIEKKLISTTLPESPDKNLIYQLLVNIIEEHYGSISQLVYIKSQADIKLEEIRKIVGGQF